MLVYYNTDRFVCCLVLKRYTHTSLLNSFRNFIILHSHHSERITNKGVKVIVGKQAMILVFLQHHERSVWSSMLGNVISIPSYITVFLLCQPAWWVDCQASYQYLLFRCVVSYDYVILIISEIVYIYLLFN